MSRTRKPPPTVEGQLTLDLESPTFVTWKKYGFRHIVGEEETYASTAWYIGKEIPTTHTRGKSICGRDYWWTEYPKEKRPGYYDTFDKRDDRRPLCGLCRRKWKSLTGQELQ